MRKLAFVLITVLALMGGGVAWAADAASEVGSIVALKGGADITRSGASVEAALQDAVQLQDIISTKANSRAKVLFLDESILTLAPQSKAVIKEFIYSRDGAGRSIFNLLDGKMRAVVGKTNFEVHTDTVATAARGTVIDYLTGILDGKPFTRVTCLEGVVELRSPDPSVPGVVLLTAGNTALMFKGGPLPTPTPHGGHGGNSHDGEGGGHHGAESVEGLEVLGLSDIGGEDNLLGGAGAGIAPPSKQAPPARPAPLNKPNTTPVSLNAKF